MSFKVGDHVELIRGDGTFWEDGLFGEGTVYGKIINFDKDFSDNYKVIVAPSGLTQYFDRDDFRKGYVKKAKFIDTPLWRKLEGIE